MPSIAVQRLTHLLRAPALRRQSALLVPIEQSDSSGTFTLAPQIATNRKERGLYTVSFKRSCGDTLHIRGIPSRYAALLSEDMLMLSNHPGVTLSAAFAVFLKAHADEVTRIPSWSVSYRAPPASSRSFANPVAGGLCTQTSIRREVLPIEFCDGIDRIDTTITRSAAPDAPPEEMQCRQRIAHGQARAVCILPVSPTPSYLFLRQLSRSGAFGAQLQELFGAYREAGAAGALRFVRSLGSAAAFSAYLYEGFPLLDDTVEQHLREGTAAAEAISIIAPRVRTPASSHSFLAELINRDGWTLFDRSRLKLGEVTFALLHDAMNFRVHIEHPRSGAMSLTVPKFAEHQAPFGAKDHLRWRSIQARQIRTLLEQIASSDVAQRRSAFNSLCALPYMSVTRRFDPQRARHSFTDLASWDSHFHGDSDTMSVDGGALYGQRRLSLYGELFGKGQMFLQQFEDVLGGRTTVRIAPSQPARIALFVSLDPFGCGYLELNNEAGSAIQVPFPHDGDHNTKHALLSRAITAFSEDPAAMIDQLELRAGSSRREAAAQFLPRLRHGIDSLSTVLTFGRDGGYRLRAEDSRPTPLHAIAAEVSGRGRLRRLALTEKVPVGNFLYRGVSIVRYSVPVAALHTTYEFGLPAAGISAIAPAALIESLSESAGLHRRAPRRYIEELLEQAGARAAIVRTHTEKVRAWSSVFRNS